MVCFYSGAPKGPFLLGFPDSSVGKESVCNAGDSDLIPGSGRSAGEGIGYPLQYSWASLVAHLVKNLPAMQEIWVRSLGWEDPLEKGTATQPILVFWPGEFHGLYSPWGCKESDMTEWLSLQRVQVKYFHVATCLFPSSLLANNALLQRLSPRISFLQQTRAQSPASISPP